MKGIVKSRQVDVTLKNDKNNFGEELLKQMRKTPNEIGQVFTVNGKEETYKSMTERSIKCALWMLQQNIQPGDIIAICTHNHLDQVIPTLAALYIGAILNPWWDHGLTPDIVKHFYNLGKPKILFVNEECSKLVQDLTKEMGWGLKIVVFGNTPGLEAFDKILTVPKLQDVEKFECTKLPSIDHGGLILYTSGTTGLPKGALHSHKSLYGHIKIATKELSDIRVNLWYATLCWVTGILSTFITILDSAKRIIPGPFNEEAACQIIEKYKINWILMGTSMANRLLKSGPLSRYDLSSVKAIYVGGAPLKEETQEGMRRAFKNSIVLQVYGTTEIGGMATMQSRNGYKKDSVGNLVDNFEMKTIDPSSSTILGANEKGEICLRNPYMMLHYYQNPEKTKEAIDDEGWLHTGDIGYYDEDEHLFIVDRLKELIKWRGHHVPPAVIEQLIQTHPAVEEVAVVGVPDLEDDERPLAFVVKVAGSNITEAEILDLVSKTLPDQMKLRAGVKFMDAIPHTASGKVGRTELKTLAKQFIRK